MNQITYHSYCPGCGTERLSCDESYLECSCGRRVCVSVARVHAIESSLSLRNVYCMALKVTGKGLDAYSPSANLHVGVIDVFGFVHCFSSKGYRIREWHDFLAIPLPVSDLHRRHWHSLLWTFGLTNRDKWRSHHYDARSKNCFDFVVEFLRFLDLSMSKRQVSRDLLCPALGALEQCLRLGSRKHLTYHTPSRRLHWCAGPKQATEVLRVCDTCIDRQASLSCVRCRYQLCAPCLEVHVFSRFLCPMENRPVKDGMHAMLVTE